jgi:hypothetical protein
MNRPIPSKSLAAIGRRTVALVALTSVMLLGLVGAATAGAQAGIYWGAQIGPQLTGEQAPWDMKAVYKFENLAKKKVSLISFQAPFASCDGASCSYYPFPLEPMQNLRANGIIPFFSWSNSSVSEGTNDPQFRLSNVINGRYDGYIREFAEAARAWGHPFFLRFDWEMNGNWFPWSEGVNGNKPGQFVAAWRHVHDIFTEVGATNATWVWCPNVGEQAPQQYPGSRYVDWTCLDGYNWGTRYNWSSWQSFNKVFHASYKAVRKIAPNKPMIIGEVASTTYGGSKPDWITDMLREVRTHYKAVHGLVWFDVPDRGTKWPIESSRKATDAFAKGIANKSYRPNIFSELGDGPIFPPSP